MPCTDIPNYIGIIGTPVIDTSSDVANFFSKTYIPNYRYAGDTGHILACLGRWCSGYNDPRKYFVGGTVLQRPSLTKVGSVVYGAFGGHCDLFNYTGQVVGFDVNQQVVVTNFALESGPLVAQSNIWDQNGGGGEGGIWMSGAALSTDGQRLFFVTGNNGQGHENSDVSALGSSGCRTLDEACVNLNIGDGGKLHLADYSQPYDYTNMDRGDQDFGSSALTLLDPTVFHGTGVSKMAVTAGKNGKTYILNANNMGGYRNGAGGTDGILQTITTNKAVFGGLGSYPLEAGATTEASAGRVATGIPTITSYQGMAGTAVLWMCDPDAGLRAWYAVPNSDGTMKRINLPQVNGLNKFQRPAFGDTRLYVIDSQGAVYCLGSPVNLPLDCTSPVDFGSFALGCSKTENVTCKAVVAINQVTSVTTGDVNFQVNAADLPQGPLAKGATFSFPVTWNLTTTYNKNSVNASYGNVSTGSKSTALTLNTLNGVQGYSTTFPISLTGTEVSQDAFLAIAPTTVDYGGLVLLDDSEAAPSNSLTFTVTNPGVSPLTILGYGYTTDELDDDDLDWTNTTFGSPTQDLGYGFFASDLPVVGTVIASGAQISVGSTFNPVNGTGSYLSYFNIWSTGGFQSIILEGSASTAPIANFSISNGEGGWLPQSNLLMDFGDVSPGTSLSLQSCICDVGGSVLEITKSKPPLSVFRLDDPTDLHESQQIPVNQCAYGTVIYAANAEAPNNPDQVYTDSWTLNNSSDTQLASGPITVNQTGNYNYIGCYSEGTGGRALSGLAPQIPADIGNTIESCAASCKGYTYFGVEYSNECYCGNVINAGSVNQPSSDISVNGCSMECGGNVTEYCGGPIRLDMYQLNGSLPAPASTTSSASAATTPTVTPGAPSVVPSAGGYGYIGCYTDSTANRALTGVANPVSGATLTIEACAAACAGFTYFGVEYSAECYCGNSLLGGSALATGGNDPTQNHSSLASASSAIPTVTGSATLLLSGTSSVSGTASLSSTIPSSTTVAPASTGPIIVQEGVGFAYLGCYNDSVTSRALTGLANPGIASQNSIEQCASGCIDFTYFGVEYGAECYCGNAIAGGSTVAAGDTADTSGCNMVCSGNSTEYCGGPNRINIYNYVAIAAYSAMPSSLTMSSISGSLSMTTGTSSAMPSSSRVSSTSGSLSSTFGASSGMRSNSTMYSISGTISSSSGFVSSTFATSSLAATSSASISSLSASSAYTGSASATASASVVSTASATSVPGTTSASGLLSSSRTLISGTSSADIISPTSATTSAPPSTFATSLASSAVPTLTGPIHVQAVGSYAYQGCWNDTQQNSNTRTLSGSAYFNATGMTAELCAAECAGYAWMGIEYGRECYCGTAPNIGSGNQSLADCNMLCPGNSLEYCGGSWRLDMYQVQTSSRLLTPLSSSAASTMSPVSSSVASSTSNAISSGSPTTLISTTKLASPVLSSVTTYSNGGSSASSSISTISSSLSSSIPAFTSASNTVLFTASSMMSFSGTFSSSNMVSASVSSSASAVSTVLSASCSSATSLASPTVSYSTLSSSQLPSTTMSSSQLSSTTLIMSSSQISSTTLSSTVISSSKASLNSLSSTSVSLSIPPSTMLSSTITSFTMLLSTSTPSTIITMKSSTVSSTLSSKVSTSPSSTSPSIHTPTVGELSSTGWSYLGCANDSVSLRALSSAYYCNTSGMTIEACQSYCSSNGRNFNLAGLEYGQECYCGSGLQNYAAVGHTGCIQPCTGNSTEICGNGNLLSLYNLTTYQPPTTVQQVGHYVSQGCYNEVKNGRLLSGPSYTNTTGMTVESCVDFCQAATPTMKYAGVEYARECYCAASLPNTATVASSAGSCNMLCTGNSKEYCGGSSVLNVYAYNATSVNGNGVSNTGSQS
ncbi:WSC domain-containing protein [Usnea florida]